MKNLNQQKIKKMARILRIILQVLFWITVAMSVAFAGLLVATYVRPLDQLQGSFSLSLGNDIVQYQVDPELITDVSVRPISAATFSFGVLVFIGLMIIFRNLVGVLKSVERDQPFELANAKRINIMGVVLLVGSVVYRLAAYIMATTIVHAYGIPNIEVNFSVDKFMLLAGLMLLILGGIFRYGNFLQDEYDHTL